MNKKTTLTGVMALLCPLRPKAEHLRLQAGKRTFKRILLVQFCLTLLQGFYTHAQDKVFIPTKKPDSAYLKRGEMVPDIWLYNIRNAMDSFQLRSVKAPITILDFWGPYCIPCFRNFPKLDALQSKFNGQLRVVAVIGYGDATKAAIADLVWCRLEANLKQTLRFPAVYITPQTTGLFFFLVSVPHYIWLNAEGRIITITGADAVTEANIKTLLQGKKVKMPQKPSHTEPGRPYVSKTVSVSLK